MGLADGEKPLRTWRVAHRPGKRAISLAPSKLWIGRRPRPLRGSVQSHR